MNVWPAYCRLAPGCASVLSSFGSAVMYSCHKLCVYFMVLEKFEASACNILGKEEHYFGMV